MFHSKNRRVIGPVADDTIATLFRNFDDGIIDLSTLVNGLKYKKISSQYFFHSLKAAAYVYEILKSEMKMGKIG